MNLFAAGVAVLAGLTLTACAAAGGAATDGDPGGIAGMCAQEQPDCVDTPQLGDGDPVPVDETGIKQFRRDARFYLGAAQNELPEHVRIGRIDDEQMMLTEDYRIGRITVELDDVNGDGKPIVTRATVELPDGPETFTTSE